MWEGVQSEGIMVSLTVDTLQASVVSFVFRLLGADVKALKLLGYLDILLQINLLLLV